MKQSITRASLVLALASSAALLAGCSSDSSGDDSAAETTSTADAQVTTDSGSVEVIDQTHLLLATAQETLEARGLQVEATDATGQGRTIDDPTLWVVVTQDPTSGEVDAGSTVALTVKKTDDPAG
ncbi:PASTA domain-containing protein [Cellulomonas sp. URHB0016]